MRQECAICRAMLTIASSDDPNEVIKVKFTRGTHGHDNCDAVEAALRIGMPLDKKTPKDTSEAP